MTLDDVVPVVPSDETLPPLRQVLDAMESDSYIDVSHLTPAERCLILESRLGEMVAVLDRMATLIISQSGLVDDTVQNMVDIVTRTLAAHQMATPRNKKSLITLDRA